MMKGACCYCSLSPMCELVLLRESKVCFVGVLLMHRRLCGARSNVTRRIAPMSCALEAVWMVGYCSRPGLAEYEEGIPAMQPV